MERVRRKDPQPASPAVHPHLVAGPPQDLQHLALVTGLEEGLGPLREAAVEARPRHGLAPALGTETEMRIDWGGRLSTALNERASYDAPTASSHSPRAPGRQLMCVNLHIRKRGVVAQVIGQKEDQEAHDGGPRLDGEGRRVAVPIVVVVVVVVVRHACLCDRMD